MLPWIQAIPKYFSVQEATAAVVATAVELE